MTNKTNVKGEPTRYVKKRKIADSDNANDITEIRGLWEDARTSRNQKEKMVLIWELGNRLHNKIQDVMFKQNCSRIIQFYIKEGNSTQRLQVFDELKDHMKRL
jgi:hypothetical protein